MKKTMSLKSNILKIDPKYWHVESDYVYALRYGINLDAVSEFEFKADAGGNILFLLYLFDEDYNKTGELDLVGSVVEVPSNAKYMSFTILDINQGVLKPSDITSINPQMLVDADPVDMNRLLLNKEDFECIGQVAKHCDWEQLCIFIREQQNLSLLPKIGQCLFMAIYDNIVNEKDDETLNSIWSGGQYIGCDGKVRIHFGLKRSLVHWAYGAYIYRHSAIDTPFGLVQKVNQDSVPVEMKEARNMNIEQRNNAKYYFDMTKDFICSVKSDLDCNVCDCECECSYCAGGGKTLQNRGNRFDNIYKKI